MGLPRGFLVSEALCAALVVLVIALDDETILGIGVNALVANSSNTATMDRTLTDRAIVFAMGTTIDSALTAIFARAWARVPGDDARAGRRVRARGRGVGGLQGRIPPSLVT